MTKLKREVRQKCLNLLQEFIEDVKIAENDTELLEKKEEAKEALELLKYLDKKIMDGKPGDVTAAGANCVSIALACQQ